MKIEEAREIMRTIESALDRMIIRLNAEAKKESKYRAGDYVYDTANRNIYLVHNFASVLKIDVGHWMDLDESNYRFKKVISFQVEGEETEFKPGKWVKIMGHEVYGILLYYNCNTNMWNVAIPNKFITVYYSPNCLELL